MSKLLDRVSKLLAQADRDDGSVTEEEAASFLAKAQELATAAGLDLAVARAHQAKREKAQEPEQRAIVCNPHERRGIIRKHFIELAGIIARVNDVEYLIGGNDRSLLALGFPEDLDMVEALFAHLSIQMVTECDDALKAGANREERLVPKMRKVEIPEDERDWGGWDGRDRYYDDEEGDHYSPSTGNVRQPYPPPKYREEVELDAEGNKIFERKNVVVVDHRVFRNDFYEAFVIRMSGRLWEGRRKAERDAGITVDTSSETALAMVDKKKAVKEAEAERRKGIKYLGTYRDSAEVSRRRDYTGRGEREGTRAAERVPITDEREVRNAR